ncbi:oxygen-independent coproporphyrinogen III oxidase [Halocola ammonii]
MKINEKLIEKYNVPAPRYTSYPTVPFWEEEQMDSSDWLRVVKRTFEETNDDHGISLYIHLPYCEALCTYCACNKRITKNHTVEESFIESLLNEWKIYCDTFGRKPQIREIHLGGGTPTFFSPENLKSLIQGILDTSTLHEDYAFSFEGHPNNTTREHLRALYEVGFRRVSYGVQDLNLKVQKTINRVQPYENVVRATEEARAIGYTSVNFDLIYGLPFQTKGTVLDTIEKTISLKPERIAFYSYAHVPWKHKGQRAYTEDDLPADSLKRKLYEVGKKALLAHGYFDVGMDHFSLKDDELYKAFQDKTMHRNFMGYTTAQSDLLIGLGNSAISDAKYAYAQNEKVVEKYKEQVNAGELALIKGHYLSKEDMQVRKFIIDIACKGIVDWSDFAKLIDCQMADKLTEMSQEGLIELTPNGLKVTRKGMTFLRNVCMVFDKRLNARGNSSSGPLFSKAV